MTHHSAGRSNTTAPFSNTSVVFAGSSISLPGLLVMPPPTPDRHAERHHAEENEEARNGPRKLDSAVSEILHGIQAAKLRLAWSKYTASGVRRSSAL